MLPKTRTKIASDIYTIFADRFAYVSEVKDDEQTYTEILEEIEEYLKEHVG
jgi:hypothetical protein